MPPHPGGASVMRKILWSPTLLSGRLFLLPEALKTFEEKGVDYLHVDVMDGHFVPNYALGTGFIRDLRDMCSLPLDIHLMIERPDMNLDRFDIRPGDIVSVHVESTPHIVRSLQQIRDRGARAFAALCPGTPAEALSPLGPYLDGALCMSVNPGFAGQKILPGTERHISLIRAMLDRMGLENADLEVDGNVSFDNVASLIRAGANMFVGGSASLFYAGSSVAENVDRAREAVRAFTSDK